MTLKVRISGEKGFGSVMKWMYITGDPSEARVASDAGADRIFVDMEYLGKAERQSGLNAHSAAHTISNVKDVRAAIPDRELLVRLNPIHNGTPSEVELAIGAGADRLMLPMFKRPEDVRSFKALVPLSTPITFLLETGSALRSVAEWVDLLARDDEVHFGLNDLHLSLGLSYLFEPLACGLIEEGVAVLQEYGVSFGIGGVARVGMGELPADWIIGEHVRLGSSWAILSRAFRRDGIEGSVLSHLEDLSREISKLNSVVDTWAHVEPAELESNRQKVEHRVLALAREKRAHSENQ